MIEEKLSEEAKWFLNSLKRIQEEFAKELGMIMVLVNTKGDSLILTNPVADPCKIIQSVPEGASKCANCYKDAVSAFVSGKIKSPFFLNCHANFAAMVLPVVAEGKVIGAVIGCGGVYEEKDKEKVLELIRELNLPMERFKAALDVLTPISREELEKRAKRLVKLIEVLSEETAFKEVLEA
jgi:ligand-binding sensor protein